VRPIFEAWLEPLHDLGATTVAVRDTGGTDHQPFDWVGIPAFQFIQDDLDYMTRTHHTAIDTYDHMPREDMMQSAVVLATFLWHAANRDELLPRKPIPQEPPEEREPTEQPGAPAQEHAPHQNH
jgi:Zn-dependent M28 family amino/carboxypeptidase